MNRRLADRPSALEQLLRRRRGEVDRVGVNLGGLAGQELGTFHLGRVAENRLARRAEHLGVLRAGRCLGRSCRGGRCARPALGVHRRGGWQRRSMLLK